MLHVKSLALVAPKQIFFTSQRLASNKSKKVSRPHCLYIEPRCEEEKMKDVTCKKREFPPYFNFNECCPGCKDVLPRFDDLYYKPSDKSDRKYQQTWSECPELFIAPRRICCTEKIDYEKMEKRVMKRPEIDPFDDDTVRLCRNKLSSRCAKVSWPGCKKGREPSRCFVIKHSSGCSKICAPYPSYSECKREGPKPMRPVECNCLQVGPLCI